MEKVRDMEEKTIEIPFGAKDSELGNFEYTIPEGFEAEINDGKIILRRGESDDEKIRKFLIDKFEKLGEIWKEYSTKDIIAYLKKQGEQKPSEKVEPKFKVGDIIKRKDTNETFEVSKIEVLYNDEIYYHLTNGGCVCEDSDNFALVEQKSDEKVEPKFRVGDWVIDSNTKTPFLITDTSKGKYDVVSIYGNDFVFSFNEVERFYYLWTIQDAKDGDVLYISSTASHETFIFKNIDEKGNAKCYFAYDSEDGFREGKYHFIGSATNCKPATKEQRDLLFQKMKKKGYEWDAEHKQLKKIEPSEWSENRLSLQIPTYLNIASDELYAKGKPLYSEKGIEDIYKCMLMWQKLHDAYFYQKPVWSDEDEEMIEGLTNCLDELEKENGWIYVYVNNKDVELYKMREWLRALKDRCLQQPKQEWSDEDVKTIRQIIKIIRDSGCSNRCYNRLAKFLNNIIPNSYKQWKPSKELLENLQAIYEYHGCDFSSDGRQGLEKLLEQLKSL